MSKREDEGVSKEERDHHANQNNPNNQAYREREKNRSQQLNPNSEKYRRSREGKKK